MKSRILILAALAIASCTAPKATDPVDYVNVLTGTESKFSLSTGNTYPAICRPWGMNFWTPQTGKNGDGWAYTYSADKIQGFKQTHQPSPWMNDYAAFSIMPSEVASAQEEARASWFSHKAETATPYYYGVYLADHDIYAEMTPTERAVAFRITYPESEASYLVVDAYQGGSGVRVVSPQRIEGWCSNNHGGVPEGFKNYFVIESDTPFETMSFADGQCESIAPKELESERAVLVLGLKTAKGQKVNLHIASSFISPEQAQRNLGELCEDFEATKAQGRKAWNEALSAVSVEDDDLDHLRTFYSCLYRSLLFPRDLSEINAEGQRVHYSPYNGEVRPGYLFGDTGFWDTFRSQFALIDLLYPETAAAMQEGLVNAYLESGFLPEWSSPGHRDCMVGNNSASVVAEAYIKGIRGYDIETLWEALVHDAHAYLPGSASGRRGWELYDSLGYVPCDCGINENAARTLEYSYDDWAIWRLGKELGKSEEELQTYKKAALNYRNLFNEQYSLMAGRNSDGSFPKEFSALKWGGDFTEGNSLHYTWSVFHDIAGLIDLMGGEQKFCAAIDNIFEMPPHFDDSYYGFTIHEIREMQVMNSGNYAHGNQPIQHVLYLYDWGLQPWKAQEHIRDVMERFYTPTPDGYCGDEDNGQTSAWYVFSALGFYPVCPASGEYALGTPLFKKATIRNSFTITAKNNSKENFYVESARLNGKSYGKTFISHDDLAKGGKLLFNMSSEPNMERGTKVEDRPYSFSE